MTALNLVRSEAARRSWDDPLSHQIRMLAIREGWAARRRRARLLEVPPPSLHCFQCDCGADVVVGPISARGPRKCSTCRTK